MPKLIDYSLTPRPTGRFGGALQAQEVVSDNTEGVGASIKGFGDMLIQEQIKDDNLRTEDSYTKLQQAALDRTIEYSKVKSGDVGDDFYKTQMDGFQTSIDEESATLSNSHQREAFQRRSEGLKLRYGSKLADHVTTQKAVFNKQAVEGAVAIELDNVASDPTDPQITTDALDRTRILLTEQLDREGVKGDARKMILKEAASNIHETVITSAIDNGDYQVAKAYFDANKKKILGERHDDIADLLEESGAREQSQIAVDGYINKGLTETEARKEARKLDPAVRDATIDRINARYGEQDQIRDRNQKQAGETAWNIYAETKDITTVPLSVLRAMDGKERASLESVAATAAKGETVKTDWIFYDSLKELIKEDPIAFQNMSPGTYQHLLGPTEMKEIINLRNKPDELKSVQSNLELINQGVADAGLDPKDSKKEGDDGDDVRDFKRGIDEKITNIKKDTGKDASPTEVQDIIDDAGIAVKRKVDYWFDAVTLAGLLEIEGVPPDMTPELAASVKRAGKEVTEANIRLLWEYVQGSEITPFVQPTTKPVTRGYSRSPQ